MHKFYGAVLFVSFIVLAGCNSKTQEELEAQEMVHEEKIPDSPSLIVEDSSPK